MRVEAFDSSILFEYLGLHALVVLLELASRYQPLTAPPWKISEAAW